MLALSDVNGRLSRWNVKVGRGLRSHHFLCHQMGLLDIGFGVGSKTAKARDVYHT